MTEELSSHIGQYRLVAKLGSGVQKTAWHAHDGEGDVALYDFHAAAPQMIVLSEISAALRLSEPHKFADYVPVFVALHYFNDRYILVRELLDRTLQEVAPLTNAARLTQIAHDLCCSLARIHDAGYTHRDIKLDNCALARDGRAVIFDLNSLADPDAPRTMLTRAPEVIAGGAPSQASDVWALGATLFALICGEYPFVDAACMQAKADITRRLAVHEISRAEYNEQRRRLDRLIAKRALDDEALGDLEDRLGCLPPAGRMLIAEMLAEEPEGRRTAAEYVTDWACLMPSDPHRSGPRRRRAASLG